MTEKPQDDHWLARPETIRKLWIALFAALALLLVAGAAFPEHGHFGLDGTFGFAAWFGGQAVGNLTLNQVYSHLG